MLTLELLHPHAKIASTCLIQSLYPFSMTSLYPELCCSTSSNSYTRK